jgi:hypothetical protein
MANRNGGIATIEGVRGLFELWMRPIGEAWKSWPIEKQIRPLEEIRPIGEMRHWLKEHVEK